MTLHQAHLFSIEETQHAYFDNPCRLMHVNIVQKSWKDSTLTLGRGFGNPLLDLFLGEDFDRIVGKDIAKTRPESGARHKIPREESAPATTIYPEIQNKTKIRKKEMRHATVRIRMWSPTILLTDRRVA